jgi:hypothetical protein
MDHPDMTDTTRLQEVYSARVAQRPVRSAHATPEALLALIERDGTEEDRLATMDHVMSCAECHRDYQWLNGVSDAALQADGRSSAATARRWWTRPAPLALAASMVLALGGAFLLMRRGPDLERGHTGAIDVIAPTANAPAAAGHPLLFVWRPLSGASRYILEVQRADGSVAFSDSTADTIFSITDPARVLPESEYRWWVRETTDGAEPRSSAFQRLRLAR